MTTLKITKQKREQTATKPCSLYVETHEKLTALSDESGISIIKLIAMLVDFGMENMVLVDAESEV